MFKTNYLNRSFLQKKVLLLFLFFILFALFFWLTPYTGDDFMFKAYARTLNGIHGYIGSFRYMYDHVNGRVAGNSLELGLVNLRIISSLVEALIVLVVLVLTAKLTNMQSKIGRWPLFGAILFLPANIFAQTYAWRPGFYNYVVSTAFVLLILWMIPDVPFLSFRNTKNDGVGRALAIGVTSIITCLYAENITIMLLFLALFILGYSFWVNRIITKAHISLVVGVVVGSIIMFSSPVYHQVASGSDNYRHIGASGGAGFISTTIGNANNIAGLLIAHNILLFLTLTVSSLAIIYKKQKSVQVSKYLEGLLVAVLSLMPLYFFISSNFKGASKSDLLMAVVGIVNILSAGIFVLAVGATVKLYVKDKATKNTVFLLGGIALVSILPFVIITPFGPRNVYLPYILLLMVCALLGEYIMRGITITHKQLWVVKRTIYASLTFLSILFLGMFSAIHIVEIKNSKNVVVQQKEGSHVINLLKYPFQRYLQDPHNATKAHQYYADCHCVYGLCQSCNEVVVKYQ